MFIEVFGLSHNPFRARAVGRDVFVGPQQANVMSGFKKALQSPDAVATVTGPVGVGKTTIVSRAMDALPADKAIARIARMQLGRSEIVEALLTELGVSALPQSTLQRFSAFKRLLNENEDANSRVFIVVEDAERITIDGLTELESLTSADTGDTSGANLILMGRPTLETLLDSPELARLKQRIRLRQDIEPFTPAEVRGYVTHRVRQAGGDIEQMFGAGAIEAIHRCTCGIPRVINSICVAALTAAAEGGEKIVTADRVLRVAKQEFGFAPEASPAAAPKASATIASPAAPAPAATAETRPSPAAPPPADDFEIPELIQDTMPEIEALKSPQASPKPSPAEEIAALRHKTDDTQPSLPVLTPGNEATSEPLDAAEELRIRLEPRAPEPLSSSDTADTQTIKALDSALRPDTQLLEALEEPVPLIDDAAPVPLGLRDQVQPPAATAQDAGSTTQRLPTLSDSMRLDAPPAPAAREPKRPDINKLEAALAAARKGPMDLGGDANDPVAPQVPPAAPDPVPAAANDLPDLSNVPEITLDKSMEQRRAEAEAKLREEVEKREAEEKAKEEARVDKAALAAAAELAAERERLSGMSSIGDQLSAPQQLTPSEVREPDLGSLAELGLPAGPAEAGTADEPAPVPDLGSLAELGLPAEPLADAPAAGPADEPADGPADEPAHVPEPERDPVSPAELGLSPEPVAEAGNAEPEAGLVADNASDEPPQDREKLEKVARNLGSATSLEDIDDMAAETLFGEEFSQIAQTIQAMAANDTQSGADGADAAMPELSLADDPPADPPPATPPVAPAVTAPPPAATPPATPTANAAAGVAGAGPQSPQPKPDIDSSAARRLAMVRSLNQNKRPVVSAPPEEIVLGDADLTPRSDAPTPEPIENQFGTSMTANLKALSEESIQAMQSAEEEQEEKKGGLLSRFKRS